MLLKRLAPFVCLLLGAALGGGAYHLVKARLEGPENEQARILMASRSLLPGTRLTREHLGTERRRAGCVPEDVITVDAQDEVVGRYLARPVGSGRPLSWRVFRLDDPFGDPEQDQDLLVHRADSRMEMAVLAREDLEPGTVLRRAQVTLRPVPFPWRVRAMIRGADLQRMQGRALARGVPAGRAISWSVLAPAPGPVWRDVRELSVAAIRWMARQASTSDRERRPPAGTIDVQLDPRRSRVDLGRGAERIHLAGHARLPVPSCPGKSLLQRSEPQFKRGFVQMLEALELLGLAFAHRHARVSTDCRVAAESGLGTLTYTFDLVAGPRPPVKVKPGSR